MDQKYIEQDAAIDVVRSFFIDMLELNPDICLNEIYAIPAADVVEVRHGHWTNERWEGLSSFSAKCSECTKRTLSYFHYNYCPNCGAKMDGGPDDV